MSDLYTSERSSVLLCVVMDISRDIGERFGSMDVKTKQSKSRPRCRSLEHPMDKTTDRYSHH